MTNQSNRSAWRRMSSGRSAAEREVALAPAGVLRTKDEHKGSTHARWWLTRGAPQTSWTFLLLLLLAALGTTGCPPHPRPATPPPGVDPPLAQAVDLLLYDLNRQLGPAPDGSRMTVFDPLLDGKTGQQTGASVVVQKHIVGALGPAVRSVMLVQFNAAGANAARNLMNGTLTALPEPNHYRLNLALSDHMSGLVVA